MADFVEHEAGISLTTAKKTLRRLTAIRPCRVSFRVDCMSVDPAGKKVRMTAFRGRSDGTPGAAIVPDKFYSEEGAAIGNVATVAGTFASTGSTGGTKVDAFSIHPQFHGTSNEWIYLIPGDTLDFDGIVYTAGDAVVVDVRTRIQG